MKIPKEVVRKSLRVLELKEQTIRKPYAGFSEPNIKYKKERYEFVELCIKYRVPYETIGNLIGISKTRIYQIQRYGIHGQISPKYRQEILERDSNLCYICRKSGKREMLHIHHIGDPKDSSQNNLISLCMDCHKKLEDIKRKSEGKLDKRSIHR